MNDVVRIAGEKLLPLPVRDDVVRRRDDRLQIGDGVAKRAERTDLGHLADEA
jgi:hypothetical protein